MTKRGDSSINEAQRYADAVYKDWQKVDGVDRLVQRMDEADIVIRGIRFKPPDGEGMSWLAIVTADGALGDVVGFHDAPTFREVLIGLVNRLENGSVKWKENKPWNGR